MSENPSKTELTKLEEAQTNTDNIKESAKKHELSKDHDIEIDTDEDIEHTISRIIQSEFSGPIPPPSIIRGYEDILPGSADRIISMAEKQTEHRQQMEHIMVSSESRDSLLGVLFAFFLGLSCIIAAVIIVVLVPQSAGAISGSILGVAGIGSIIATFIKSTRAKK